MFPPLTLSQGPPWCLRTSHTTACTRHTPLHAGVPGAQHGPGDLLPGPCARGTCPAHACASSSRGRRRDTRRTTGRAIVSVFRFFYRAQMDGDNAFCIHARTTRVHTYGGTTRVLPPLPLPTVVHTACLFARAYRRTAAVEYQTDLVAR